MQGIKLVRNAILKNINVRKKYFVVKATTIAVGLLSSPFASAIDVSTATTELTALPATILEIGVLMLVAAGTAVAIKWAKATFFG